MSRIGLLSVWASRLGGGVFEAVVNHAHMLRRLGHDPHLFALQDAHSDEDRQRLGDIPVTTLPVRYLPMVGYAPGMVDALLRADLDVLHLHGIWMYPSLAGARWAGRTRRPYLISPHGMLDPWIVARGRPKKMLARIGYERSSWRNAAAFHALTGAEAADIERESPGSAVRIIPNAVHPAPDTIDPSSIADLADRPFFLSLGRIHPKKNLLAMIDGWLASTGPQTGHRLVIAGWGEPPDVAVLESRVSQPDAAASVRFIGPAFGHRKAALLAQAQWFLHPSLSEGLPMAVLEAWAAGTPTILSDGCNLPEGFKQAAAIRTEVDASSIRAAIDAALAADRPAMALAARALADGPFSPAAVADRWDELYRQLVARTGVDNP